MFPISISLILVARFPPTVDAKIDPEPKYRVLRTPRAASLLIADEMKAMKVCHPRPKNFVTGSMNIPIL